MTPSRTVKSEIFEPVEKAFLPLKTSDRPSALSVTAKSESLHESVSLRSCGKREGSAPGVDCSAVEKVAFDVALRLKLDLLESSYDDRGVAVETQGQSTANTTAPDHAPPEVVIGEELSNRSITSCDFSHEL